MKKEPTTVCFINNLYENTDMVNKEYNANAHIMNKLQCMICFQSANSLMCTMLGAKCGHVACKTCWEEQLNIKLECPYCKNKVREKNLIKIVKQKIKVIKRKFL